MLMDFLENEVFNKLTMDFVNKWAPAGTKVLFLKELGEIVLAATREDPYDPVTRRRLNDGKAAVALIGDDPRSPSELDQQLDVLRQGMGALQSLDDLGSPEANKKADDDMRAIQNRFDELTKRKEGTEVKK